jgi:hypothetical protein
MEPVGFIWITGHLTGRIAFDMECHADCIKVYQPDLPAWLACLFNCLSVHTLIKQFFLVRSWLGYHIPLFTSVVIDKCWPFGTQFLRLIEPYWAALSLQGSNFASWIYFNLPQLLTVMRQVISACAQLYVLLSGWASHFWEMLFT